MKTTRLAALLLLAISPVAHPDTADDALARSIEQLRSAVGRWDVVTEFLNPDGSVSRSVDGSYEFEWVIEDRLVRGESRLPELDLVASILFYIDEADGEMEMISVGRDGRLWIMSGPLGGETRYTQEYDTADGGRGQLRFTRYNVGVDRFESRMEYTRDGGETWLPGNHQEFRRAAD